MAVYRFGMLCYVTESGSRVSGSSKQVQRHYIDLLEAPIHSYKPNWLAVESMSTAVSSKGMDYIGSDVHYCMAPNFVAQNFCKMKDFS